MRKGLILSTALLLSVSVSGTVFAAPTCEEITTKYQNKIQSAHDKATAAVGKVTDKETAKVNKLTDKMNQKLEQFQCNGGSSSSSSSSSGPTT